MPEYVDMDADALRRALDLVYRHTGITMVANKKSMLQTRLRQRMRALQLDSYLAYLERVEEDPSEHPHFIDVVTTHHTTFFRTPRIWRHVEETFLPEWTARSSGKPLRAWSAACSSGEEVCSLAISLEEYRRKHTGFDYEIVGTDISEEVVEQAAVGEYSGTTASGFRSTYPELFERYNHAKDPNRFQLAPEIRKHLSFSTYNLLERCPWKDRFDLVFLRNVLIYFQKSDIEKIVRNIAPALRRDGLLIIGEAESLASMTVPFQFVRPQIYKLSA